VGRAERLEKLVDKALERVDEILELPFDAADENFPRVLSAVKDTAINVVNLQLKADENHFRAKSQDGLMKLLADVLAKEGEVGTLIDATPTP
jgi:hypothetical protein